MRATPGRAVKAVGRPPSAASGVDGPVMPIARLEIVPPAGGTCGPVGARRTTGALFYLHGCEEYERRLGDVAAGRRDAVVAYHQDRLHRQPIEAEHFVAAMDAGS